MPTWAMTCSVMSPSSEMPTFSVPASVSTRTWFASSPADLSPSVTLVCRIPGIGADAAFTMNAMNQPASTNFTSSSSRARRDALLVEAAAVLAETPDAELTVVAPTLEAGRALLRELLQRTGRRAALRWRARTLRGWAYELALPRWAKADRAPLGATGRQALIVGMLAAVEASEREELLGRYLEVAARPGFATELGELFAELGGAPLATLSEVDPVLGKLFDRYARALESRRLVDSASVYAAAEAALAELPRDLGLVVALDLDLERPPVRSFFGTLSSRSARVLASWTPMEAGEEVTNAPEPHAGPLGAMRAGLFGDEAAIAPDSERDDVAIFSAADESREAMEIVRRCLDLAERGVPFDAIGIVTLRPGEYRGPLLEAFARAGVTAHLSPAVRRPDPAGRAFLALIHCAEQSLSAERFAEYLSLAVVPLPDQAGAPPEADPLAWAPSDDDLLDRDALAPLEDEDDELSEDARAIAGQLRVPRAWERVLVEAAVIGHRDRWERRLRGYEAGIVRRIEELEREDPEHPRISVLRRERHELGTLRDFALPLLDELVALPPRATWGEWAERLGGIATRALRDPTRVLQVLGELAPMGSAGPVRLVEVRLALTARLSEVPEPTTTRPQGAVIIATAEEVRGRSFAHVFVPGLSADLYPPRAHEHPFLRDVGRARLELPTRADEAARARGAFQVALGAAEESLTMSWARASGVRGRERVPSFYVLDAVRAARGSLPATSDLRREAARAGAVEHRWPAPADPRDAVDVAEFDLAMLHRAEHSGSEAEGVLRYAIRDGGDLRRSSVRRWARDYAESFRGHDGLVSNRPSIRAVLRDQRPDARPFSASALQNLTKCPYAFFLYTIARLHPVERPEAISELDALHRGSLVHEVIFEASLKLREQTLFGRDEPQVRQAAWKIFDETLAEVAARYAEELAPAIEGIWQREIDAIRVDLHQLWDRWVEQDWVPERFELAFGLPPSDERDPLSSAEPVRLDEGIVLRGAIDAVDRLRTKGDTGALRVTDYKTGRRPYGLQARPRIGGGKILQPALYALALEKLAARGEIDGEVQAGRLYYATSRGEFRDVVVPLDDDTRQHIADLGALLARMVGDTFLPAAPAAEKDCQWCDYRDVCGPGEVARAARKNQPQHLVMLADLRKRP